MIPDRPGNTASRVQLTVVHPQDGSTASMTSGAVPLLEKWNRAVTGVPWGIRPKSCSSVSNRNLGTPAGTRAPIANAITPHPTITKNDISFISIFIYKIVYQRPMFSISIG